MKYEKISVHFGLIVILTLFLALPSMAGNFDFSRQCRNGRAFFDISNSNMSPEIFGLVLNGVKVTHMQLEEEGLTPDFVLSIRGMNLAWITEDADESVKAMIAELYEMGIRIQTCSNMLDMLGIDSGTLLPEIDVVQNAWVSAILHQNALRGYAYISF